LQVYNEEQARHYLKGHPRAVPPLRIKHKDNGVAVLYPCIEDTLSDRYVRWCEAEISTCEMEQELRKMVVDLLPFLHFIHHKVGNAKDSGYLMRICGT
jgi:hypothetical protein